MSTVPLIIDAIPVPLPPPVTGVPSRLDPELEGRLELELDQKVTQVGSVSPIAPPEKMVRTLERRRLELERQMLTGERPIPPDWRKVP